MEIDNPSSGAAQETSGFRPRISRRMLAAVASSFFPGLGHWMIGARVRAIILAGSAFIYCALYVLFRFPKTYLGLIASTWVFLLLLCLAAGDALRCHSPRYKARSSWWAVPLIPVAIVGTSLYVNALIRISGFRLFDVPSTSMEGTIIKGDHLIGDLRAYRSMNPQPGDVVLFRHEGLFKVKRLIAVGRCTVSGEDNVVFVDGRALKEEYVSYDLPGVVPELATFGPVVVPSGKIFVMGDKRDVSLDSRTFGPIDQQSVIGKSLYIVRPLSRAGDVIH